MISWRPQIGDPSVIGWVTVVFYFFAAVLSFVVAVYHKKRDVRQYRFWGILALFMVILGVNKQLDIQSLFTEIGRIIAKNQGWYIERRPVQFVFVCLIALAGLTAFVSIWWMLKNDLRVYLFPLSGIVFLITFIIIRAASFHHFDTFLKMRSYHLKMNWVLELGGIGIIILAAVRSLVNKPHPSALPFPLSARGEGTKG